MTITEVTTEHDVTILDGCVAVSDGMVYLLTGCCQASGKGGGTYGVICRKCYRDVPDAFGWGHYPKPDETTERGSEQWWGAVFLTEVYEVTREEAEALMARAWTIALEQRGAR